MKKTTTKQLQDKLWKKCRECGKDFIFNAFPSQKMSGHVGAFCSSNCYSSNRNSKAFYFYCTMCDKKVFTQPAQMKHRNRKTCSRGCYFKYRSKIAEERRLTGIMTAHQIDRAERYSKKAGDWRNSVFKRDDYTCQECGIRGTYLEADHIKPWVFFKELRYELDNGRTLCRICHNKTKTSYKVMRQKYEKGEY